MNRNIPLVPTLIFLLAILSGILFYLSKTEEIVATTIQQVVKSNDGTVWAVMGDTFIDLSSTKDNMTFSQHGFDYHVGQVVPLKSGEWLLNVGAQGDYVKKAISRSLQESADEHQASGSLLKCSNDLKNCRPWGEVELQFDRAFEGFELENGNILIFKAERKRIFLVDNEGIILDELNNKELWFGINRASTGELFGLQTDADKLVQIIVDGGTLKVQEMGISFDDISKVSMPSKVIEHHRKYWFLGFSVDSDKGKLEQAKDIVKMTPSLFSMDSKSKELRKHEYSFYAGAELERIGDEIYFSDFDKYEIKKFDLNSHKMSLVQSAELAEVIEQDKSKVNVAKKSLYRGLLFNFFGGLIAFTWLILKSTPIKKGDDSNEESSTRINQLYNSSQTTLDRELAHIAKMFAKKNLSRQEMAQVAPFKKVDSDYVFFPQGVFGKGLLIPDAESLVALYKWNQDYHRKIKYFIHAPLIGIAAGVLLSKLSREIGLTILGLSIVVLTFAILILPAWYYFKRKSITKGFLTHDSRLTFGDVIKTFAKSIRSWQIWGLIASSVLLMGLLIYMFISLPGKSNELIKLSYYMMPFILAFLILGLMLRRAKVKLDAEGVDE